MPWYFPWSEAVKNRACRYLLQRYLGQYLEHKLTLDQLSVDLYSGVGRITDIFLDVVGLNELGEQYHLPLEFIEGYVGEITISIPWSSLLNESIFMEVRGLRLTVQPKQRDDFASVFDSMWGSMTSSIQIAEECLRSEKGDPKLPEYGQPLEGLEMFAQAIDTVLSKVKVRLLDTTFRVEHVPKNSNTGVAFEIRVKQIDYFDEAGVEMRKGEDMPKQGYQPAAFSIKKMYFHGVSFFVDEFPSRARTFSRSHSSSLGASTHDQDMFQSFSETLNPKTDSSPESEGGSNICNGPEPILLGHLTGRQELRLRLKLVETVPGVKVDLELNCGSLILLFTPRQAHIALAMLEGIASPSMEDTSNVGGYQKTQTSRDKPMESDDFEKVEKELQRQIQEKNWMAPSNLANMQGWTSHSLEDEEFLPMRGKHGYRHCPPGGSLAPSSADNASSQMDTSTGSLSSSVTFASSTAAGYPLGSFLLKGTERDNFKTSKKINHIGKGDEGMSELTHFQVRLSSMALILLHDDILTCAVDGRGHLAKSSVNQLKSMVGKFFSSIENYTSDGFTQNEFRKADKIFRDACAFSHCRLLAAPVSLEGSEKSSSSKSVIFCHLSAANAILTESLCMKGKDESLLYEDSVLLDFGKQTSSAEKQSGKTDIRLDVTYTEYLIPAHHRQGRPHLQLRFDFAPFTSEVDISITDRLGALLWTQLLPKKNVESTGTLHDMISDPAPGHITSIQIVFSSAKLHFRFPIPDLRPLHDTSRAPWWQRNVRPDAIVFDLSDGAFSTTFESGSPKIELDVTAKDIHVSYLENASHPEEMISFLRGSCISDAEDAGIPRLTLHIYGAEAHMYGCDRTSDNLVDCEPSSVSIMGPLVKECEGRDPSPFTKRQILYNLAPNPSHGEKGVDGEELVVPSDKAELDAFIERTLSNCQYHIDLSIPSLTLFFPSKKFYELIYNRLNTDLLMWEPAAPHSHQSFSHASTVPSHRLQDSIYQAFTMCKSGLLRDSDSDTDEERGYNEKTPLGKLQRGIVGQNEVVLTLSSQRVFCSLHVPFKCGIDNCCDMDVTYFKDEMNDLVLGRHGELLVEGWEVDNVPDSVKHARLLPEELRSYGDPQLTLYLSDEGVPTSMNGFVGKGMDSLDMITLVIEHNLDKDHHLKRFQIALAFRGTTLRYRMFPTNQGWLNELIDFFDVVDFPLDGYEPPTVVSELHLHFWGSAIDYRPLNLPLRAMITVESFTVSGNLASQTSTSLLRFIIEDGELWLSDQVSDIPTVSLHAHYACVVEVGLFDITLRLCNRKDTKNPRVDFHATNNVVHIRTCADSFQALTDLIKYLASKGDLVMADETPATVPISHLEETVYTDGLCALDRDGKVKVPDLMAEAMKESSSGTNSHANSAHPSPEEKPPLEIFFYAGDEAGEFGTYVRECKGEKLVMSDLEDALADASVEDRRSSEEDFCILENDPGTGILSKRGEPQVKILTSEPISVVEHHFKAPIRKADILKAPKDFPQPTHRYTLHKMSLVWHIYGGWDFDSTALHRGKGPKKKSGGMESPKHQSTRGQESAGYSGSKPSSHSVHFSSEDIKQSVSILWSPKKKSGNKDCRGGVNRDINTAVEFHLLKMSFQHEVYPESTPQASRQVLVISDIEILDRLSSSQINKFLYLYSSEAMPRQTHANMLSVKAVHSRPDMSAGAEECSLRISVSPLRLNVDQDALFFLHDFFLSVSGGSSPLSKNVDSGGSGLKQPVMKCGKADGSEEQDVSDEEDGSGEDDQEDSHSFFSEPSYKEESHQSQPIYFRSVLFSPEVPIRVDYHGKRVDLGQGPLRGLLIGLAQLNCSELCLKRIELRHGILGVDRLMAYLISEWANDIRTTQLPNILGGVGPIHAFVQLFQGLRDLVCLPVEQYQKDGRIVRGLQKGAASFSTSTAGATLELTNRLVQAIQLAAETAYDMVSPGPSVRSRHGRRSSHKRRTPQPADLREGVSNAYQVVRTGLGETAHTLVLAASREHEHKGVSGAVGGVLRQLPPTIVRPIILATEATSSVLDGMRNQLIPDVRREQQEKWKTDS
ncbi:unnamed protein product [Darwinula stevensoni]|uniref:Autophagy-related protein 2 n=1 Tax=Darwinula stevensoni TaxID=69355 RepID=A0A7R9A011_9CRUS|nr:unnamed protein product [Darwinula stevensoni]CAG0883695.1 unnamed protein product [Darwinula stevensoni]